MTECSFWVYPKKLYLYRFWLNNIKNWIMSQSCKHFLWCFDWNGNIILPLCLTYLCLLVSHKPTRMAWKHWSGKFSHLKWCKNYSIGRAKLKLIKDYWVKTFAKNKLWFNYTRWVACHWMFFLWMISSGVLEWDYQD